jgi:hypothetical protein
MKNLSFSAAMRIVIVLLFINIPSLIFAQDDKCGTIVKPTDITGYRALRATSPVYTSQSTLVTEQSIPLYFWVILNSSGGGYTPPTPANLDDLIDKVNPFFNFPNNIKFKRCGVSYINDDNYFAYRSGLNKAYYNCNALNVYIVNSIGGNVPGFADFPWNPNNPASSEAISTDEPNNQIVLIKDVALFRDFNKSVFAHELGHAFGLFHTFHFAWDDQRREQVARIKCDAIQSPDDFRGDGICDTPADYGIDGDKAPSALQGNCKNSNCTPITCQAKDDSGTPLSPAYTNMMSYFAPFCRDRFTNEQQGVMDRALFNLPSRSFLLRSVAGVIETQCSTVAPLLNATVNMSVAYNSTANPTYIIPCKPYSTLTTETTNPPATTFNTCALNPGRSSTTNPERNYQQIATLNPVKNSDYRTGVSITDASLIQQHILDILPLNNSYKKVAADVDKSGEIDGADILFIKRLILGVIAVFPNNVGSWQFVPKYYLANTGFSSSFNTDPFTASYNTGSQTLAYLGTNTYLNSITLNLTTTSTTTTSNWSFNAIKMGDVNCNASLIMAARMAPNTLSNLDNKAVSLKSGKEVTVLIKTKYAGKISTFQTGFNFTNSAIQITSIEKGDFNSSNDVMDYIKLDKGEIRALWYNEKAKAKSFTGGVTIMKMKVKALKDISDLLAVLSLDDAVLQSEFYDDKNMLVTLPLTLEADVTNTPIANDAYSVKVYPNPFTNTVTLEVTSATKENANLTIVSAMGALLYNKKADLEVGVNTITIENTSTFPTGVLSYNLKFGNRTLNGTLNKAR